MGFVCSQALVRECPIAPTVLISSMTIDKFAFSIDFQTPEDIFWCRDPTIVWRVPQIIHMDVAPSSSTTSATLATSPASTITSSSTSSAVARTSSLVTPLLGKEGASRPKA